MGLKACSLYLLSSIDDGKESMIPEEQELMVGREGMFVVRIKLLCPCTLYLLSCIDQNKFGVNAV